MLRTRRHHVVDARAHSQIPGHNQYVIVHLRASELSRVLTPRQSILDEGAPHTRTPRTIAATVQCAKSSNVTRERMNMYARVETSERNCGVNRSVPQHICTMFFCAFVCVSCSHNAHKLIYRTLCVRVGPRIRQSRALCVRYCCRRQFGHIPNY